MAHPDRYHQSVGTADTTTRRLTRKTGTAHGTGAAPSEGDLTKTVIRHHAGMLKR